MTVRVPVLMYHSVTDRPNAATRPLAVTPAAFAEQLAALREGGFTPLTLSGLLDAGRGLPGRPVVITFDDGYADFHSEALPILTRFGFPATVFTTSGWVQDAGHQEAGRRLDRMLSWGQLAEAAECGVEIGGHSHSHPQLDQLPTARLRDELRRNKALLEDRLGRAVTTMAYPYGYSSARVRAEVRAAGYTAACAVANDLLGGDGPDRYALPRLTVGPATSIDRFRRATAGRSVGRIYLRERVLTKGYAVVRRTRYGLRRVVRRD
ncbi:polysaccharide deacetylase family protein [Rhizohabitans arisaemae]|uniref:polysaccharide deacetylase family protein n=1 Tax=Rhizohabitans arisaemae TaxID=2720610 RepID=UPI0024B24122|nr:polysaccharide deacetylase family protein [Rhizohabitans arisaemae]